MNQSFELSIATNLLEDDAKQLGVPIDDLRHISITVTANIVRQPALQLQLSYQIDLPSQAIADQLVWSTWQSAQVGFADYLWQETCLECFITGSTIINKELKSLNHTESYIEINVSSDGRYALYKFESYRNPTTLPPPPLYQANGRTRIAIDWACNDRQQPISFTDGMSTTPVMPLSYHHERRFGIDLIELPNQKYAIADMLIEQIHPCVILQLGERSLYFAPNHASPPDFHNQDYWSNFEL